MTFARSYRKLGGRGSGSTARRMFHRVWPESLMSTAPGQTAKPSHPPPHPTRHDPDVKIIGGEPSYHVIDGDQPLDASNFDVRDLPSQPGQHHAGRNGIVFMREGDDMLVYESPQLNRTVKGKHKIAGTVVHESLHGSLALEVAKEVQGRMESIDFMVRSGQGSSDLLISTTRSRLLDGQTRWSQGFWTSMPRCKTLPFSGT